MRFFIVTAMAALGLTLASVSAVSGQTFLQATTPQPTAVVTTTPATTGLAYDMAFNGGTAAGSYFAGVAAYLKGMGDYNYQTSLALTQREEARKLWMANQIDAQQKYYELHRMNDEWFHYKNPPMTPEQREAVRQMSLPKRLTASQLDPVWGAIRWPSVLQRPEFDRYRTALEDIFAHRSDGNFGPNTETNFEVQKLTKQMRDLLDQESKTMISMEFVHANRFLESLAFEGRFPAAVVETKGSVAGDPWVSR